MGRYLGTARHGVWGTSGALELMCNEAVLSIGEGKPGIHPKPDTNESYGGEKGRYLRIGLVRKAA